ncbi:NAD(P)H-hydrate epimerase [Pseudobowmanella zhangzhouensis]|uniref:NAD(P)H-hydrate epimerase n=1 Tax=Pseudobowmanella zhangzhouensis TaxID=1537679 RepID=UPI00360F5CEE
MTTYEVRAALKNHARLSQLIYPAQQVRAQEQAAAEACGLSLYQLMELAGQAVFEHIQVTYPDKRHWLVCCGKGNNGGDGWVVARLAHQQGLRVEVWTLCPPEQLRGDAAQAYRNYLAASGTAPQIAAPQHWRGELIVDAILGNNVQGPVREPQLSAINWINQQTEKVVSIDLPSGLAADSGATVPVAIQADSTITLVAHKLAPLTGAGRQLVTKSH